MTNITNIQDLSVEQLIELKKAVDAQTKVAREAAKTDADRAREAKNADNRKYRGRITSFIAAEHLTRNRVRKSLLTLITDTDNSTNEFQAYVGDKWHDGSLDQVHTALKSNAKWEKFISKKDQDAWEADYILPADALRVAVSIARLTAKGFARKLAK